MIARRFQLQPRQITVTTQNMHIATYCSGKLPLANINETDDDDWEDWEMEAYREQQEQIARDCRLLAQMHHQQAQAEQLKMAQFMQEEAQRLVEMEEEMAARMRSAVPQAAATRPASASSSSVYVCSDAEVILIDQKFTTGMRVRIHPLQTCCALNGNLRRGWC